MRRLLVLLALLGTALVASPAAHAADATTLHYVRPVTTEGRAAPGWTVTRESGTVDCYGAAPSAVNPGITSCSPSAYQLRACWKSRHHTVLCVRDALDKSLVRVRYAGRYPDVEAPAVPTPADLVLGDGRTCLQRVGGAWGAPAQHPQWFGFDSCTRKASVYGPGSSRDGIDRSSALWTVKVWRTGVDPDGDHLVTRKVTDAYLLGTAAA